MPRADSPIRVLVVDDSDFVREMVSAILTADPEIAIAGHAANGLEAVGKASALKPDVVTMDIEMPVMDGLKAIENIMAKCPMPILVLTSQTGVRVAYAAVTRGALDVMEKPTLDMENGAELIKKIKLLARMDIASLQKAMGVRTEAKPVNVQSFHEEGADKRIVAIAASTGGPKALEHILSRLPAAYPVPIVISQHVAHGFAQGMAEWLNVTTPLTVSMAHKGDILRPGHVYLNPSELSMSINRQGIILLSPSDARQVYHPSCDAMLRSVADAYGPHAVGVILTGMGDDGVEGMKAIKEAGGVTLAQDEKSSIVFGMNGLAVKKGVVDRVMSLNDITASLVRLTEQGLAAKP